MTVSINGVDKQGVYINGVQVKQALSAANETVNKGVYDATTLSAVDAELATANIKNGITIFGFAGDADVRDISDATAIAAEVIEGETFYAVSGGIRTGTMPIEALDPALNEYPAGYHVGAASLTAVDAQLVTGSIKYGVTIFGVAGHTNVRDSSDANLTAAEAPTGKTFYAGGGAKKTGTGTKTLSDANDTVAAGYYAATTLHDVDAHLASANIKSGVTIFGFAGNANVVDTSSGDAVAGDIRTGKKAWVDGAEVTGNIPEVAIVAGSEAVPAGIHTATTLSTIDTDLTAAKIKSGITIFGKLGTFTNTGSPPAAGDVKSGKVCWANGAQITGTMPTVALDPDANAYPTGYHAGAASLTAVDGDLVTGSIKYGVTIFGVAGHTNVRDSSDANATAARVRSGYTFYAGGGPRKTGTLATKTLSPLNDTVAAGYYVATTLSAVDSDLATANIKSGKTIFGFAGKAEVVDTTTGVGATAGDIKDGKVGFVNGSQITGSMPTVAITAANDDYPAGYHAGNAGGLDAIDTDLKSDNIKYGVTIFGKAGSTDVRDSTDANALVGDVKSPKTFYAGGGAKKTGTMPTVALDPAANAYPAGYHAGAASLTAVDADLAAGNIKDGVEIFGVTGTLVEGVDVSDANALVGEVKSGRTFYSVAAPRKTGTMPTVAITAANDDYPAGYHAGNAGGLDAIDTDLKSDNIKYGVTIFGKAGSTDVRDSTDANATATRVRSGYTFYAGGGARKTGTLPTRTLSALNDTVAAGYYAATTLSAVDAQLAVANIKSGVNIFGFVGTFTNTGSPPAAGDVKSGKVCWANGAQITGTMPTVAITAANDDYPAGYHAGNAGGLDAIDTDLKSDNIKYGVTIFGKAGSTDVRDSTDANALVGDVKDPKTFYAGGGAKKTGTMPTVALDPAANAYPAGYHAGAASLTAVDAHLAAGNIKDGVEIFGVTGTLVEGVDVSDANALVGEVKSGRTFYSVAAPRKTGTMPTVAITAANDDYPAGYHAGNAGGLDAIDTNLAPANIKSGVNIFGKVGTLEIGVSVTQVLDVTNIHAVNVPADWGDEESVSIPATALAVVMTILGEDWVGKCCYLRGVYNGVERIAQFKTPTSPRTDHHSWCGAGSGSVADAKVQAKRYNTEDECVYGARFWQIVSV